MAGMVSCRDDRGIGRESLLPDDMAGRNADAPRAAKTKSLCKPIRRFHAPHRPDQLARFAKKILRQTNGHRQFYTMTWKELCLDRRFQDLPFKIELNRQGQIIMSPTRTLHGYFAAKIAELLKQHITQGKILVECAVDTGDGTKEADVVWVSDERFSVIRDQYSCSIAPEICIEIMSPSNTRSEMMSKKELYLRAGAQEYWLCDEKGQVQFFNQSGSLPNSVLCPGFPSLIES